MPMKLNVGVCRKIGQPDYGSLGASCNAEVELSSSLIFDDPEAFQRTVRQVHAACDRAVDEQLGTQQQPSNGHTEPPRNNGADAGHRNGNGQNSNGGRSASDKQLAYIRQLSGKIKGLGVRRLDTLAQNMFGKPLAGLTSLDASGMIDTLKGITAGEIDLQAVLDGAAT